MLNKCCFIGNLGRDPEIRTMSNGNPVVNLSIGISENWKDKSTGERKTKTEWVRIVIFNEHLCMVAEKYLRKGSKVYVEGQLQTRKWNDSDGIEKYTTEIVLQRFNGELTMLGGKPEGNGYQQQQQEGAGSYNGLDDDIPF